MKFLSQEFFIRNNLLVTGYKDYTLAITEGYFNNYLLYQIYLLDDSSNTILFESIKGVNVNNVINDLKVFLRNNNKDNRFNALLFDINNQLKRDNAKFFFVEQGTRIVSISHYKDFRIETLKDYD